MVYVVGAVVLRELTLIEKQNEPIAFPLTRAHHSTTA